MKLHELKAPKGAHKKRKILGRGSSSGHGKTSTRGSKGQTSRSGRATYPGFEGGQSPIIRRMPKRAKIKDTNITPALLLEKGLVKSKNKLIKILGDGELNAAITIQAHAFSKSAQEKIKKAGGNFEVVNA
jgi:large subunit ribosomal protein L15